MQNYKAPKTDTLFVMNEVFNFEAHYQRLGFTDATPDLVDAIYAEAAKFAEECLRQLMPLVIKKVVSGMTEKSQRQRALKKLTQNMSREAGHQWRTQNNMVVRHYLIH